MAKDREQEFIEDRKRRMVYTLLLNYNDMNLIKEFVDLMENLNGCLRLDESTLSGLYRLYTINNEAMICIANLYEDDTVKLNHLQLFTLALIFKNNQDLCKEFDITKTDEMKKFLILIDKFLKVIGGHQEFSKDVESTIVNLLHIPYIKYLFTTKHKSSNTSRLTNEIIDIITKTTVNRIDKIKWYVDYCADTIEDEEFQRLIKENKV